MGRVVHVAPVEELVKDAVNTYIKDSTVSYPNFLDTAPIFVTYYSRNAFQSTYDESFETYNEIAGEESPNKFHRIDNLPLYSLDMSDFGTEMAEDGWTGEVSSSGIILPNTVKPKPDDLIELNIHSKKYLFVVTNGTADNFGNNKFYKINFRLSSYKKEEAERNTTEEFVVDYNLIGKQANTLVKKSYHKFLNDIRHKFDELLSAYRESYFDNTLSAMVCTDFKLLDPLLNHFIFTEDLIKPYTEYRNSTFISSTLKKYTSMHEYKHSIFPLFIKNDYPKIIETATERYKIGAITKGAQQYQIFYYLKNKSRMAVHFGTTKPCCDNDIAVVLDFSFLSIDKFLDISTDSNLKFIYTYSKFFTNLDKFGKLTNGVIIDDNLTVSGKEHLDKLLAMIDELEPYYAVFGTDLNATYMPNYYSTPIVLLILKELFHLIARSDL